MARLANLLNKVHLQFPQGSSSPPVDYYHDISDLSSSKNRQDRSNIKNYNKNPAINRTQEFSLHDLTGGSQSLPDFCNAFWGESGYDVLISRVKQSSRMLEDLKIWYKERSSIELEYSKKLFRLSKSPVLTNPSGSIEPIALKSALDSIRQSTEKSAHSHAELSGTFKTALYGKFCDFISNRDSIKKNPQATVEKLRKNLVDLKLLHEKARRKYEADAIATNGYVTQLQLSQGRDSDKVSNKLDKVHMSIKITEKDYRTHNKNLQDTTNEWITQWKQFCDLIQDLEEDRVDFVRNTFWDYANAISAICVAEDEQCECIRQSLERCEARQDVKTYVRQVATGNEYTLAPNFVDYTAGEIPRAVTVLTANFIRTSTRKLQEDTTLVPLSTPLQGMVQSIKAGPQLSTEYYQNYNPNNSGTVWENKIKIKRGGAIAEAVASNSLNPTPQHPKLPSSATTTAIAPVQRAKIDLTADNLNHLQQRLAHANFTYHPDHVADHPNNETSNQNVNPQTGPHPSNHNHTDQARQHPKVYPPPYAHSNGTNQALVYQKPPIQPEQIKQDIADINIRPKYWPLTPVNLNDRPLPPPPA